MKKNYSAERNVQILIALLKEHGIKKVIASPGAVNINFVASIQQDSYFEIYSSVDERSAAYIACGLAEESGEPVVLTCTGATASRNYIPGLTEAYYRKLPIVAITATQDISKIGHLTPQAIDRTVPLNDIVKSSVYLQNIKDMQDEWDCEIKVNKSLLDLCRNGGGPVHINLATMHNKDYSIKELPSVRSIRRICMYDDYPVLKGKVAVFVGTHTRFTQREESAIEQFCEIHGAVVFCDHTSNYKGKHRVLFSLVAAQRHYIFPNDIDVLIHIGEITGDYYSSSFVGRAKNVWRINKDGELRDTFKKLRYVFEMPEYIFFEYYSCGDSKKEVCLNTYKEECEGILNKIPELPFSNIWIAQKMSRYVPENSVIHLGILNTLRAWNFFELPESVYSYSNVGGFGIDGNLSSLLGASLAHPEKLYFGFVGDLAFFYDMNVIGNRHVCNNIRIMLINNGKGTEFRNFSHSGAAFDDDADKFIAASGHYGNKNPHLIKHYAIDLGYEYLSASSKDEFDSVYKRFLIPETVEKPMIFEVFTDSKDESEALELITGILRNVKGELKCVVKKVLGEKEIEKLKNAIKW